MELPIDFSEVNYTELTKPSNLLEQILLENGMGLYVEYLSQIRIAADNKNESEFRKLVEDRDLFGGSGALLEIYIENQAEYTTFNKQFCEYIDLIIRMRIRNGRIKQIKKTMQKLI